MSMAAPGEVNVLVCDSPIAATSHKKPVGTTCSTLITPCRSRRPRRRRRRKRSRVAFGEYETMIIPTTTLLGSISILRPLRGLDPWRILVAGFVVASTSVSESCRRPAPEQIPCSLFPHNEMDPRRTFIIILTAVKE